MDLRQYWPQIGSSGTKPDDGKTWEYKDTYHAPHLNYIWNYVRVSFGQVEDWINDLENGNIAVQEANYANDADASTFKDNDIDSDGDGRVNTADHAVNADQLGENEPAYYASDADLSAHEGDTSNPHNVDHTQTGAASATALNDHEVDSTNPHDVTYEQTGAASNSHDNAAHSVNFVEGDYEIQVDGQDGEGIINFKTE